MPPFSPRTTGTAREGWHAYFLGGVHHLGDRAGQPRAILDVHVAGRGLAHYLKATRMLPAHQAQALDLAPALAQGRRRVIEKLGQVGVEGRGLVEGDVLYRLENIDVGGGLVLGLFTVDYRDPG